MHELLGDSFDLEIETHVSTLTVESGEAYWELFSTSYGPTKTLVEAIGDRSEELHQDWVDYFEETHRQGDAVVHEREYLLVLGVRR